jgi:hypothetical protein
MNRVIGNSAVLTRSRTTERHRPRSASGAGNPILITEEEVLFGTAAAVALRPTTKRWWPAATGAVLAAVKALFQGPTADGVEPHRHYPKRYAFLEDSCMGREMGRL